MQTTGFLRDIDDERLYAQQLELAWIKLGEELSGILGRFPLVVEFRDRHDKGAVEHPLLSDLDKVYAELATMRHTMGLLAREMADRAKRLADAAVGLADVILDEQST